MTTQRRTAPWLTAAAAVLAAVAPAGPAAGDEHEPPACIRDGQSGGASFTTSTHTAGPHSVERGTVTSTWTLEPMVDADGRPVPCTGTRYAVEVRSVDGSKLHWSTVSVTVTGDPDGEGPLPARATEVAPLVEESADKTSVVVTVVSDGLGSEFEVRGTTNKYAPEAVLSQLVFTTADGKTSNASNEITVVDDGTPGGSSYY